MNQVTLETYSECSIYSPIQATKELDATYEIAEVEPEVTCDSCLHFNGNTCKIFNQEPNLL